MFYRSVMWIFPIVLLILDCTTSAKCRELHKRSEKIQCRNLSYTSRCHNGQVIITRSTSSSHCNLEEQKFEQCGKNARENGAATTRIKISTEAIISESDSKDKLTTNQLGFSSKNYKSTSTTPSDDENSTNKNKNTHMMPSNSKTNLTIKKPINSSNVIDRTTYEKSNLLSNNGSGTSLIITDVLLVVVAVILCLFADVLRYK
ncbi:hypothetical protein CHUAL_003632 [Chamberlinius hualienensis]